MGGDCCRVSLPLGWSVAIEARSTSGDCRARKLQFEGDGLIAELVVEDSAETVMCSDMAVVVARAEVVLLLCRRMSGQM